MNLLHLKYAVEIAGTNSITKAAEKLYTSQPNLSRSIRELEENLGIKIFTRTSKGIYPTAEGEEFLGYARKILSQVDEVEKMYRSSCVPARRFSISVPRASYIACAFTEFVKRLDKNSSSEIFYKETNSMRAVNNIVNSDYKLGILRYQSSYDKYFREMLEEKELASELISEFCYVLIMSENHPLAEKEVIKISDLKPYTEIAHADQFVPSLPLSTVRRNELSDEVDKHIFVFERASQMDILSHKTDSFMWVSPVPQQMLDLYSLVERRCEDNKRLYRDLLIYRKGYKFSPTDEMFIEELMRFKQNIK